MIRDEFTSVVVYGHYLDVFFDLVFVQEGLQASIILCPCYRHLVTVRYKVFHAIRFCIRFINKVAIASGKGTKVQDSGEHYLTPFASLSRVIRINAESAIWINSKNILYLLFVCGHASLEGILLLFECLYKLLFSVQCYANEHKRFPTLQLPSLPALLE